MTNKDIEPYTHWQEAIDLEHAVVRLLEAVRPWEDRWEEHDGDPDRERVGQEFDIGADWVAAMPDDERWVYVARLVDIVALSYGLKNWGEPDRTTGYNDWPAYERLPHTIATLLRGAERARPR